MTRRQASALVARIPHEIGYWIGKCYYPSGETPRERLGNEARMAYKMSLHFLGKTSLVCFGRSPSAAQDGKPETLTARSTTAGNCFQRRVKRGDWRMARFQPGCTASDSIISGPERKRIIFRTLYEREGTGGRIRLS
jgi:hypothetical protein